MTAGFRSSWVLVCTLCVAGAADDLVIADFEGTNYGRWVVTGEAFGPRPARGPLPGQMPVDGFSGKGLVNSFYGGDKSIGTLTSPPFTIERPYITFLIGGGGYSNETCMNLLVDGKVVRTATGPNTASGGTERLQPSGWDVRDWQGRSAVLEIVDRRTGGWGHINVDQIVQSDRKPVLDQTNVSRALVVEKHYLHLPVKNGAPQKRVEVLQDGKVERFFDIELADADPDWRAFLDLSPWKGRVVTVRVSRLREDSRAFESIQQSDELPDPGRLYHEALRPQLHFSARRGWNNDPNGLVFFEGRYHLFFQHNPYGWGWGNMHWGHAVSSDLFHWHELEEALYPDAMGPMFSGSAVVDWRNTSGFGDGRPPMVLIYTAAGNPTVQCLAYSRDAGSTFSKYAGNPVVPQITDGNRDPKVFWHEPSRRWVMVLYVGFDQVKDGRKNTRHTIHFLTSPDLKQWTVASQVDGLFECPDFFELPVDGNAREAKWVLTAASSEYLVGRFDGRVFSPETPKLPGHRGKGFYAAQTYSDVPDGRRIQVGWLQAPSPGMPFNQCMSLPLELTLRSTPEGPRLAFWPLPFPAEMQRRQPRELEIQPGQTAKAAPAANGLYSLTAAFEPAPDSELTLTVNGVPIVYDAAKQEIAVHGHRAPAPLRQGRQRLMVVADRTAFEVFASDGLTYVPMPVIPKAPGEGIAVSLRGGPLKSQRIEARELQSIWRE